ncbi:signal peptide peptidase SppA [bacterium]|nr:signal peptide peptidase SppA [bacterium]
MKDFFKQVLASALGTFVAFAVFNFFMIIIIFGIIGFFAATHGGKESSVTVEEKSILFINVEGEIAERRGTVDVVQELLYEEKPKTIGLFEIREALESAATDDKIKGIYLRLRYVQSGWAKIETLRNLLKKFKKSGKFIIAYSEAYDEKMYYLASVANEILMYPKGEFEFNGIYSQSMFFKKTLAKLEVEPTLIRAGKFKSAGEMITEEKMSDENRLQVTELTQGLWDTVVGQILEEQKNLTAAQLNEMAEKVTLTSAKEAYNLKLVSQLIPIEEVEKKLLQKSGLKKDDEVRLISWNAYGDATASSRSFLSKKKKVAVILAEGEIQMGSGSDNEAIYSDELSSLIREINKDKDVKAVVLRVNSPGGSALASDVIWRSIEYLKKNKKVVTSFSDVAASGGYYIAAGTDYIFAEPTTITGSIGVFGMIFNTQKFFDNKLGVTFDGVKTHASADMMSGSRALTPYEKMRIQEEVTDIYGTFLSVVQQGRKKFEDVAAVREVAEGRVWLGNKAMEIGLVDEMGSLDQAIAKAAELSGLKNYDVVLYPDEKRWIDKIFDSLGDVSFIPSWLQKLAKVPQNQEIYWARWPYDVKF